MMNIRMIALTALAPVMMVAGCAVDDTAAVNGTPFYSPNYVTYSPGYTSYMTYYAGQPNYWSYDNAAYYPAVGLGGLGVYYGGWNSGWRNYSGYGHGGWGHGGWGHGGHHGGRR